MSKKDDEINRQLILNSGGADPEDYLTPKQLKRYNEGKDFGDFIDINVDLVMNQEEGLDEIIKKQDEDLTEKYKEQQNPQNPNTLEEILKEKETKGIIDEVMGPDEDDDEGRSQYVLNRLKLNQTRFTDPNRFQNQLDSSPEMTMQDISETYTDFKAGAMGGSILQDYSPLPKGVLPALTGTATAVTKKILGEVFESSFFKNLEPMTVYALGKKNSGNPNWRPNLKQFGYYPDTKDAVSQFGQQTVDDFMERARLHRVNRASAGKKEIMKDFNETLEIIRPDGTVDLGMVVRRKGYGNKLDLTDSSNYHVRTLSQVMNDVRVNTGWLTQQSSDVKAMQLVRSKLNQLKTNYSDDLVLAKLMEYGDEAYLEHMIGKDQYGWLWDRVEAPVPKGKTRPYPWVKAPERNHVDNLRLLVSKPYKTLKDQTEGRIKPLNIGKQNKDKYIINIEDPMTNPYAKDNPLHKSNPGNILIQTAKPSDKAPKTIGIIGDYLQDLYGPDFMKKYNGNELLAVFENMSPKDKKLYGLYAPKTTTVAGKRGSFQKVESATKYRRRIFDERIDLILKEKGKFSLQEIQTEVFNDLLNFYELFSAKANFVRRPKYVSDMMQKNAIKDIKFPFSKQKFDQFYSLKRKAEEDIARSIGLFETGQAPRMTKKAYNNLWRQLTEITAMDYNFKVDENDFTTRLYNIMNKYPE